VQYWADFGTLLGMYREVGVVGVMRVGGCIIGQESGGASPAPLPDAC
jgi:hypothetical protein